MKGCTDKDANLTFLLQMIQIASDQNYNLVRPPPSFFPQKNTKYTHQQSQNRHERENLKSASFPKLHVHQTAM